MWRQEEQINGLNETAFTQCVVNVYIAGFFVLILYFVDGASRYTPVMKTNLNHCLSSIYFVNQPLHVSGIFVAHHQEVFCIHTIIVMRCAF